MDTSSPAAYLASGGTLTNGQIPTQTAPTGTNVNSPVSVPIAPTTLNSSNTTSVNSPVLPVAPIDSTNYAGVIAGTVPYNPSQDPNSATSKSTGLLGKINDLTTQDQGKTAYTQSQLDSSGATALQASQNSLTAKLAALNTEAQNIPLQDEKAATGITGTTGVKAQDTRRLRDNAIQALTYKAQFDMQAGDLLNAKDNAQRAVDLKYKDIETQISQYSDLLKLYDPFMSAEEKKQTEALTLANDEKKTALADQKKQQQDVVNTAQTNGDVASASAALKLDPLSSTFKQDLANIQAGIKVKATTPSDTWSTPYSLGGNTVQKNNTTGEIRTVVNNPNPTNADKTASALTNFSNAFVAGAKLPSGVPVLDVEGKLTPEAWKAAIKDAPAEGLTRTQFIENFASYIVGADGLVSGKYDLTPKEIADLKATSK